MTNMDQKKTYEAPELTVLDLRATRGGDALDLIETLLTRASS